MMELIAFALYTNLIIGNATWNSTSSTSGLLQNLNKGLQVDTNGKFANPLGAAIVIMVFVICLAVASFTVDLPIAAAFGGLVGTGTALLLQTPAIGIVGPVLPYVFGSLTVIFILLALAAGTKSPFR